MLVSKYMKDENIKNDGIRILESMLNKWRKEKKSESKNYIFLPKFLEDVHGFHMVFPIYEEFDQNNVKLVSWLKFSLEENNLEENEVDSEKVLIENLKNINYQDKKYTEFIELLAQVFYLSINLRRLDKSGTEYLDAKGIVKEKIDDYTNLARKKGLKNCIDEDELEKYISIKAKEKNNKDMTNNYEEIEMPDLTGNSELKIYNFSFNAPNRFKIY